MREGLYTAPPRTITHIKGRIRFLAAFLGDVPPDGGVFMGKDASNKVFRPTRVVAVPKIGHYFHNPPWTFPSFMRPVFADRTRIQRLVLYHPVAMKMTFSPLAYHQ